MLIEDDLMVGRAMRLALAAVGFMVDWVTDGRAAEIFLASNVYDIAVLDLSLPSQDGISVLRNLRLGGSTVPVLVASARDADADRRASLDAGADGFLLKPFGLDDLTDCALGLLWRTDGKAQRFMGVGSLTLDIIDRIASYRGSVVGLNNQEFSVLEKLVRAPDRILLREQFDIGESAGESEGYENPMHAHIRSVNAKFGHEVIKRVRGVGYRLACNDT